MNIQHMLVDTIAHIPPANALEDLTEAQALVTLPNTPHSIAEILAHMDFWQTWFLHRCEGVAEPMVQSAAVGWPAVPTGSWPDLRANFLAGARRAAEIGSEPGRMAQPIAPPIAFPPLDNYLIADALTHIAIHNSHHMGQIITLRQLAGLWPPPSGSWTF